MKKFYLLVLYLGIVSSSAFAQDESETEDLTDYKIACLAAIDNISKIGGGISLDMWESLAFNTAVSGAKAGLDECETSDAMFGVMIGLRALTTALLQTKVKFNENLLFTGLIGNHSFDTGDLSSWSTMGFDLEKIDISQVTTDITTNGDVSGLIDAFTVNEWKEETHPVVNEGDDAVSGGHNKYYLNSDKQLIIQPIIGLPAGVYSFSAKVATMPYPGDNWFLPNSVYLNALVIPYDIAREYIDYELPTASNQIDLESMFSSIPYWDIIFGRVDLEQLAAEKLPELLGLESVSGWSDLLSNTSKILENIEPLMQAAKLYSGSIIGKGLSSFSNVEMKFMVDEGDIVILGINAGATQFIGAEQYRADNLKLTGLKSVGDILASARADLAAALEGLPVVEANYNANATAGTVQPAFTYEKTATEKYNNVVQAAQNRRFKRLRDILTQDDLNDLDVVDEKINKYIAEIAADIEALNAAKEDFDKNGFIAPQTSELFNILMNLATPEWTGNAVSVDENMTMRFSQKPGKSALALAFSFEKASESKNNQLYAFVSDGHDKYYIGEKNGNLALTMDKTEAVIVTAVPSYTTEGEISLMVGDVCLGTTSDSDILVKTEGEGQLTGLAVSPAASMKVVVTIPTGREVGTVIFPFDADFPYSGVSGCAIKGIGTDMPYVESEPITSFKANTPYCIMAGPGKYVFEGVSRAIKPSYSEGPLVGTYTSYTTQGGNEYKLTVDWDGFYVFNRADGQYIPENECYLKCDNSSNAIFLWREDAVTGISSIANEQQPMDNEIYNLAGQRLQKMQKGIYIQGGKKILR